MLTQIAKQEDRYLKQNNVGIKVLFEFALHVYFTPAANKTEDLDFVAIDTASVSNRPGKKIAVKVKNTGNIISDAVVEFEFIHQTTGQESKLSPVAISMMPGASQIIYFDVPGNLKGAFKGVSILRIGDASNVKVGEKTCFFSMMFYPNRAITALIFWVLAQNAANGQVALSLDEGNVIGTQNYIANFNTGQVSIPLTGIVSTAWQNIPVQIRNSGSTSLTNGASSFLQTIFPLNW